MTAYGARSFLLSLPFPQPEQAPDPLAICPGYRQSLVKGAANVFRLFGAPVTAPLLHPAQLSLTGDLETFCRRFVGFDLGHDSVLLPLSAT